MFGKVKKITAKILGTRKKVAFVNEYLGLSIVSLDLIQIVLSYLNQTLDRTILNVKENFISNGVTTVNHEIESHISEIKAKICLILKTKYKI